MNNVNKLAKTSRRSAIASIIGLIIVVASLLFSLSKLTDLQNKIDIKQVEYDKLSLEKTALEDSVKELSERVRKTMLFDVKKYNINWRISKTLASTPRITALIDEIREMVYDYNPSWKLGGTSPESGFDSPSFAAYILIKKLNVLDISFGERYKMTDIIPATDDPRPGDLIFYDGGYAMFYMKDRGHPFCVGMTPLGIASLEIDFGPRLIKYGRIDY